MGKGCEHRLPDIQKARIFYRERSHRKRKQNSSAVTAQTGRNALESYIYILESREILIMNVYPAGGSK